MLIRQGKACIMIALEAGMKGEVVLGQLPQLFRGECKRALGDLVDAAFACDTSSKVQRDR